MTTCRASSSRINLANAAPTSVTSDSSISSPTRPRTSYALITRLTTAADRDIKRLLTMGTFRRKPSPGTMRPARSEVGAPPDGGGNRAVRDSPARLLVGGVGQHPKMPASASGAGGALPGLSQHAARRGRGRRTAVLATEIVKSVDRRTGSNRVATLAYRCGQRDQIVLVGVGGQRAGVADQFPAARRGDATGVADAQVPGVRVA